jgi:type 1 fimbria pilin
MAFRTDLSVDWTMSPRIAEIATPSTTITIQDLYDTLAILQARVYNLAYPIVVAAAGKETLRTGVFVGVTLTLQDCQLKFADRGINTRCTVTDGNLVAVDNVGAPLEATDFSTQVNVITEQSTSAALIDAAPPDECKLTLSYVEATSQLDFRVWLERAGAGVTAPTAVTVSWYNPDGTTLLTVTQADALAGQNPNARGIYAFRQTQALADDAAYDVEIAITDSSGTITTRIPVQTIRGT